MTVHRLSQLVALLSVLAGSANAATIEAHPSPDGSGIITVEGHFVADDAQKFNDAIALFTRGTVIFASTGGNLEAGLKIGTEIRMRNFTTAVMNGNVCASACALAWLGGSKRIMGETARVGFHAAYELDANGEPVETGAGNALVGSYLNRLGLSDRAVIYITQADPESITWLTPEEAQRQEIDVTIAEPILAMNSPSREQQTAAPPTALKPQEPAATIRIGPSLDCNKASTQVQVLICATPALARIDLEYVQPYYVLRQIVGPTGWRPLLVEAVAAQRTIAQACEINPDTGTLPVGVDQSRVVNCLSEAYQKQRTVWLSRLSGAGYQEAMRPVAEHIALQEKLKGLGFLPSAAQIDGVYGTGTRSAIASWQTSAGLEPTGLLGDADAERLLSSTQSAPVATAPEYSFVCPEFLPSASARLKALADFLVWVKAAHPELTTEAQIASFRYDLLTANHCTQTLANIARNTQAEPDATLMYETAVQFRHDLDAGGMSLVSASVRSCYFDAGADPDKLKPCMLYDSAAFRMDSSMEAYLKMQGVSNWQRSPYFTDALYSQRMTIYEALVFKSESSATAYLVQPSLQILKEAVNLHK